eukprot:TRINITY_DN1995_c0_g1_i1.p1 TRINITY_DN1995_c0_g1~~TRINITY_DN1995_c0_g1_i1.p1  ORF type:complete len:850 (-),score=401.43 TRINITY_DN1995_c0_g1_i1:31-2481(-)
MQRENANNELTVPPIDLEHYFGASSRGAGRLESATDAHQMNQVIQNTVCTALQVLEQLWDRMGSEPKLRNTVKQTLLINIESSCQTLVETQLASEARLLQSINAFLSEIALTSTQLGFSHHLTASKKVVEETLTDFHDRAHNQLAHLRVERTKRLEQMQQMHNEIHADLTILGISFQEAVQRFSLLVSSPSCLCQLAPSVFEQSSTLIEDSNPIFADPALNLTEQNMQQWAQLRQIIKHKVAEAFQSISSVQNSITQAIHMLYGQRAPARLAVLQKAHEATKSVNLLHSLAQYEKQLIDLQKRISALQLKNSLFETSMLGLWELMGVTDQTKSVFFSQLPAGLSKTHMDFMRLSTKQLLSQKRQRLVERLSDQHNQMNSIIQDLHFTSLEHQEWFPFSFALFENPEFRAVLTQAGHGMGGPRRVTRSIKDLDLIGQDVEDDSLLITSTLGNSMMTMTNEPTSPSDLDFDSSTTYRRADHSVQNTTASSNLDGPDHEDDEPLEVTEEDKALLNPSNLEEQQLEFMLRELSADVQSASTLLSDIQPIAVLITKLDGTKAKLTELKKSIEGCPLTTRKAGAHQQLRLDLQQQTKLQSQLATQTQTLLEKLSDWEIAYNRVFHWNGVPLRQTLTVSASSTRSTKPSSSSFAAPSAQQPTSSMPAATPARQTPAPSKSGLKAPATVTKTKPTSSIPSRQTTTISIASDAENLVPMTPQHRPIAHASASLAPRTAARAAATKPSTFKAPAPGPLASSRPRDISNRNDSDLTSFLSKPSAPHSSASSQENQSASKPSSSRAQGRLHYQFSVEGEAAVPRPNFS